VNDRGSYRHLLRNSKSALLAAIEIYNKPRIDHRDECFVTVTAYRSPHGRQWAETGSEKVDLAETAYVGLAAGPLADKPGGSITFDNITVIAAR
jgi:hypothetical protein